MEQRAVLRKALVSLAGVMALTLSGLVVATVAAPAAAANVSPVVSTW